MAKGVNKAIIIGNLGADPDTKYAPSGTCVCRLSVATSDQWRDKQTGEQQERTEWHRVVLFNKLGEVATQYLRKGAKVYIEGRIQTRKWQGQDGVDRYTTEIVAGEMQMLDSRGQGGGQSAPPASGSSDTAREMANEAARGPTLDSDFDDDIPF